LLPLRGTFELVKTNENLLFTSFVVTNIAFTAGSGSPVYTVTGSGSFQIGGEVALHQEMTLSLKINDDTIELTNSTVSVSRRWPMIEIDMVDAHPTATRAFYLTLAAAPVREIWFSTAHGFTPADSSKPRGSPGDLLSSAGRVVRSNQALIEQFFFSPPPPDGNDAFDIRPGGEILFSLNETAFSQDLGAIQHGDLLSEHGQRLYLNQQLVEEFGLASDAIDLGLDAFMVGDDGDVLFSITTDMDSPKAGVLHRGDLLSNRGVVVKHFGELLARFHPQKQNQDFGLDALYLWPSAEIWFSTEDNFTDEQLGQIRSGDLLSDQGYIVFRNLELLGPFQPVEDLADFGLDGLFVITDYGAHGDPARLFPPKVGPSSVQLRWEGNGRVFQLEKANTVNGPWRIASPLIPSLDFEDTDPAGGPLVIYRLKQW
jgi:hypothetical protein